jgi:quercetin dioxygenase-like cupin family protein
LRKNVGIAYGRKGLFELTIVFESYLPNVGSGSLTPGNPKQEMKMKLATTAALMSSALLLVPPVAFCGDTTNKGVMLSPDQIEWTDNPRVPGLRLAKILGDAKKPGPFVHRVKFPKGRIVQAHSHPDDRSYTVLSGTWYIGWGDRYDPDQLTPLAAGSFYTEPAGVPHFISTPDGEAVVQITGTGPTAVKYVDPAHAPKN